MPTFVPATKYQSAYWRKTETEYRVTTYRRDDDGEWQGECDHHKKRSAAIAAAKAYANETDLPAVVERLTWTLGTWDAIDSNGNPTGTPRDDKFEDWDREGPKETLVYGEYPEDDE